MQNKIKRNNALWVAEQLGIKLHIIDIVEEYKNLLYKYRETMDMSETRIEKLVNGLDYRIYHLKEMPEKIIIKLLNISLSLQKLSDQRLKKS